MLLMATMLALLALTSGVLLVGTYELPAADNTLTSNPSSIKHSSVLSIFPRLNSNPNAAQSGPDVELMGTVLNKRAYVLLVINESLARFVQRNISVKKRLWLINKKLIC